VETGKSGKSSWLTKIVAGPAQPARGGGLPPEKMAMEWNQCPFFCLFMEAERRKPMAQQSTANLAFERAWSVYLLINSDVNENDQRRSVLERFIRKNCEAGENDPETLTVGGLTYLKKLDELEKYSFR
jgi:hypothetical protein